MKMQSVAAILIALAFPAAAGEPLALKGLQIGIPAVDVKAKFVARQCSEFGCYHINSRPANSELDTLAGVFVKSVFVEFYEDRLADVRMSLAEGRAEIIVSAISEKYGVAKIALTEFKTKGGLSTQKKTWKWVDGDAELQIESPSGSIDDMSVTLRSRKYLEVQLEKLKQKAKTDL